MSLEEAVLSALRRRNANARTACTVSRSCRGLLGHYAALQAQNVQQKLRMDLLSKEKHDMEADLRLLRQNEANAGVSSEHIQLLQQQLESAKSKAARHASDASAARAKEAATGEAAREVAAKSSERTAALSEAIAEATALRTAVSEGEAREAALRGENEQLLQRLMQAIERQAQAMDSEVRQHEEHRRTLESGQAAELSAAMGESEHTQRDAGRAGNV